MLTIILLVSVAAIVGSFYFVEKDKDAEIGIAEGNYHTAYYGKNKHVLGRSLPCEDCVTTGCTGAGECRCVCHEAVREEQKAARTAKK